MMGIMTQKAGSPVEKYYAADESETTGTLNFVTKISLTLPNVGQYLINWQCELAGVLSSSSRAIVRLYCPTNATEYGYGECDFSPYYLIQSGVLLITTTSINWLFEIQVKHIYLASKFKRARIFAMRIA